MFVGITRSILLVIGIVSIDAGRYVSVLVVFLLEYKRVISLYLWKISELSAHRVCV
jgi:hypothetical protein